MRQKEKKILLLMCKAIPILLPPAGQFHQNAFQNFIKKQKILF